MADLNLRYITRIATKPAAWNDEDRKALSILSRLNSQGSGAPPFIIKHMLMSGIVITETSQLIN